MEESQPIIDDILSHYGEETGASYSDGGLSQDAQLAITFGVLLLILAYVVWLAGDDEAETEKAETEKAETEKAETEKVETETKKETPRHCHRHYSSENSEEYQYHCH